MPFHARAGVLRGWLEAMASHTGADWRQRSKRRVRPGAMPSQDSAGQGGAEQSGVEETAEGARRALVAPPGGKKVPATVTAGTEVWGVSHRSARCDCSSRRPAPTRIDLNQTDLIPSCRATLPGDRPRHLAPTRPRTAPLPSAPWPQRRPRHGVTRGSRIVSSHS
jgi:hypothetical protein